MEGNLSLADAKAAVENKEDLDSDILDLTQEQQIEQDDSSAWSTSTNRRRKLLAGSFVASGAWIIAFGYGVYWALTSGQIDVLSAGAIGILVGAFCAPLCLIWIMTLVLQRSDPLLERRLAIARTLQASIAPVDAAEAKLDRMLQRLQRDIAMVDQTVMLASERIGALEGRFKDQVSNLFSTTTDAEAKSATIRDQLRRERDSMEGLIDVLGANLADMRSTMEAATEKTINSEMASRDAFSKAAKTFEDQYSALLAASETTTQGIGKAMNSLAERTTALDAAALSVTQKLGKGAAALKAHEEGYRTFVTQFSEDFKSFDGSIDTRLVALEAAQNRLDTAGSETASTLEMLGAQTAKTVEEALEKTADAANTLGTYKDNVAAFMANTLSSLDDAQQQYQANLETFKDHTRALSAQAVQHIGDVQSAQDIAAKDLYQAVQSNADQWISGLSKFNAFISDSTERAGSVAAARIETAKAALLESVDIITKTNEEQVAALHTAMDARKDAIIAALQTHEGAMETQCGAVEAHVKTFNDVGMTMSDAVSAATQDVSQLRGDLESSVKTLGEEAKANAQQVLAELAAVSDQTKALESVPGDLTQAWSSALDDARKTAEDVRQQSESQLEGITDVAKRMQSASDEVALTVKKSVETLGEITGKVEAGAASSAEKVDHIQHMMTAIETSTTDLQAKLGTLSQGFETLKAMSSQTSMVDFTDLEAAKTQMEEALSSFDAMAKDLREKAASNTQDIAKTYSQTLEKAKAVAEETEGAAQQAAQNIAKSSNQAIDLARLKWSAFSEEKQAAALDHFENVASRVTTALNTATQDVQDRIDEIDKKSRTVVTRLSEEASAATLKNKETMDRVEHLTQRVETHTTSDLIRASSLIVDALNSLSIDVSKSLNSSISDEDWGKYLAGDKSIFTRQTVQALSKSDKDILRKRLDKDDDLKETVYRYMKDFELLMTRAMRGNEPTSLSIAIVSSDIGKLYVALSQTIRRLN